jgi:hypothetical protein
MSTLPIPLLEAPMETALCIYGIVLLRHYNRRQVSDEPLGRRVVNA